MRKLILVILLVLLTGCNSSTIKVDNKIDYILTEIPLRSMLENEDKGKLEFRQIYNNELHFSYLNDNGIFYSTNHVYTFNIDTFDIEEFVAHDEFRENQRVWSFIIFNSNEWLYCVVDYDEDKESGLLDYQVIYEKGGNKEILLAGTTNNYYTLPDFLANNQDIYFLASTLLADKEKTDGEYQIGMYKFNEGSLDTLYVKHGPYEGYYLEDDTQFCGNELFFNEESVSFISQDANNYYLNSYQDQTITTKMFDKVYSIVDVKDYLLITNEAEGMQTKESYSTVIMKKSSLAVSNYEETLVYMMIIPLSNNTYVGVSRFDSSEITVNRIIDEKTIITKIVSEPQDIIAYRRVDENKVLLLSNSSEKMSYIVEIK